MRQISVCGRIILAVILAVSFSYAHGQAVSARIKGTITDPTGAVVPQAKVTVTNMLTGVISNTATTTSGDYIFSNLPIGTYKITVNAPGFKAFSATGIKLNIDQEYVESVKLSLGSSADTVSVEADAVQVNTTDMQLSNIVDAHQITELPLIGRAFTQLEQGFPGVQASNDRFGSFSVNGSQTQQSAYIINGADSNDLPLNTVAINPNIDALAQFNLITGPLNAEYDRNGGAVVNVAIKQGTNHFHGDIFEFYRDTFLNTRNYFQKLVPTSKFHQNIFGGTIGGPVFRDRLFFFGAYEGTRQGIPQAGGNVNTFTAGQVSGDYSAGLTGNKGGPVFSTNVIPLTINIPGCVSGVDTFLHCMTANGGHLPPAAINPISATLAKSYIPPPNSGVNTFAFSPTATATINQYIGRVDYNITPRDQIYAVYIRQKTFAPRTLPFTGATVPGFGDQSTTIIDQGSLGYTRQISSTMVNDIEVHYTRFNFDAVEPQKPTAPSSVGFAISPQNTAGQGLPLIAFTGNGDSIDAAGKIAYPQPTLALGFSTNGPQPRIDQVYQLNDSVSKNLGHHNLKFGYDLRRYNVSNPFSARNNGSFAFDASAATGNPNSSGDAALDFLLGIPASYTQGSGAPIQAYAFLNYFYAQDTWKATTSLTLSYGLGYQIDTPLHNRQFGGIGVTCFNPGVQSKVFPSAPKNLVFPGDPGCNDATGAVTRYSDFGPRIGFAWAPDLGILSGGSSRKLSLRGGYGIYYNRTEEETSLQNLEDPPFGVNSAGAGDYTTTSTIYPSFQNPYQDINTPGPAGLYKSKFPFVAPAAGSSPDFGAFLPFGLSQYNSTFRSPYSENVQLTLEREFPGQVVARASYVGTFGKHNEAVLEGNPITQAGHDACLALLACSGTPTKSGNRNNQNYIYPTHTQYGYPDVANGGVNDFASMALISSISSSNYNSLQLSVDKGLTHGLQMQASYTYSHSLDDASSFESSGFGGFRGYNQFPGGKSLNYGNSAFDARQRFTVAPIYVVPFKQGGNAYSPMNLLLSGWQISGIATFATGFPYDVSYGGGSSLSLWCSATTSFYSCPDVPIQVAPLVRTDPRTYTGTGTNKTRWFQKASFAAEPIGQFGNVSRYKYHGAGINNTNLILAKNFALSGDGTRTLQLRMESDNVFNHTQFTNPNGSFTSTNFGLITSAAAGRQTQLAAKIYF